MRPKIQVNRAILRFAELVQKHFAFLEAQGFRRVRTEPTIVRFESPSLFINIYHGRSSFEIGAELGRLEVDEDEKQPYPMSALLGVVGVPMAKEYRDYATRTPDGVNEGLAKLAKLFREHISQNLQNTGLFQLLMEQRKAWGNDFAQEVNLSQARHKLETAWHAKDYNRVVELLYSLRDALTPTELQKLDYAEKHLGRRRGRLQSSSRAWRPR